MIFKAVNKLTTKSGKKLLHRAGTSLQKACRSAFVEKNGMKFKS